MTDYIARLLAMPKKAAEQPPTEMATTPPPPSPRHAAAAAAAVFAPKEQDPAAEPAEATQTAADAIDCEAQAIVVRMAFREQDCAKAAAQTEKASAATKNATSVKNMKLVERPDEEPRLDWWEQPVAGWAAGKFTISNMVSGETVEINLKAKG